MPYQNARDTTGPAGGHSEPSLPDNPNKTPAFEVIPTDSYWSFSPVYYPERLTQAKPRKLNRSGSQCGGENVRTDRVKNREVHVTGTMLDGELSVFHKIMDYEGTFDVITPTTPSGGLECRLKKPEIGEQKGWDPQFQQWQFEYTLDFVSTGRDEYEGDGENQIITDIRDVDAAQDVERGL
jgi:hypothetical protein